MNLKNKVALITGASSGIGKSISLKLAEEGVKVILLARRVEKLKDVKKQIESKGGKAVVCKADVTKDKQLQTAVKAAIKKTRGLDILINNAGLGIFKTVEKMEIKEWDTQLNVMLRGTFLTTKFAVPYIYKKKKGHIINLTSLWAKKFCATCSAYTAAKFGIRGFTQSLREEARQHNVKVTNIMPGTVDTPFFKKAKWETNLSKALKPEDIADSIVSILKLPDRAVVEEIILQAIKPDQPTC